MIKPILIILITIALLIVVVLLNKLYFKKRKFGAANDSMRFLAWFFDMMLLNIIFFVSMFMYWILTGQVREKVIGYIEFIVNKAGYSKLRTDFLELEFKVLCVYLLYSIVFESLSTKGTYGKQYVKIQFESGLSLTSVLIRNVVKPMSLLFFPIMFLVSRMNEHRQWPHDLISGSKIIKKE